MKAACFPPRSPRLASGLLCLMAMAACSVAAAGPEESSTEILRIYDGDTILVRHDGREEKVRLIGIDAPEAGRGGQAEVGASEATAAVSDWLAGRHVRLVTDPVNAGQEHRDIYGRLLAYVDDATSGADLGLTLMHAGRVRLFRKFNFERKQRYGEAEAEARRRGVGLWARGGNREWTDLLAGGADPILLYPTGGDLWAICVAGQLRLEVRGGELTGILVRLRELLLADRGAGLARRLQQQGFKEEAACRQ